MKQQLLVKYSNTRPKTFCQRLLKKKIPYAELQDRMIVSNVPDPEIGNNSISTSKYNLISFPIFNLLEQFTKPSNIYFLLVGILQMIPAISVSEGKPTMFFPLVIVVLVSMVKDFFEDWKRRASDKKENRSQIEVLGEIGFSKMRWEGIQVGNIIKVYKDEYFPCDVLLIKHSTEEAKVAYVETKNLDGETNLKLKKAPQALSFLEKEPESELEHLQVEINYERPNPFISSFNGNLKMAGATKKTPLEPNNIILRGCSLKINSYAIGICIYNGHETKIMMNGGQSSPKRSSLELILNSYFKYICIFQIGVTLLCSLTYGGIVSTHYAQMGYILESPYFLMDTVSAWGSWFISISNFIPISLLVTLEMIRYGQGFLLNKDKLCASKGFYTEVQTSSVNEELGQIEYVLSDKTGTLTQNLMEFKCISIGGRSYGAPDAEASPDRTQSMITSLNEQDSDNISVISETIREPGESPKRIYEGGRQKPVQQAELLQVKQKTQYVDFKKEEKERLIYDLKREQEVSASFQPQSDELSRPLHLALLHLALCHNVIKEGSGYTSSSPDELALVSFAKYLNYEFVEKDDSNNMVVEINGVKHHYELLHVLEFSSQRKRMSVILRDNTYRNGGRLLLLTKGADDVIISRSDFKEEQTKALEEQLYGYASQGLRTLVLAWKQLDYELYKEWEQRYEDAITLISNDRFERIHELESEIEKGLHILGATAIEDKLQDEVKETITELKRAGMKVWMLTGDKRETAVSIGYACGLIDESCEKITLDCEPEHAENLINNVSSMLDLIRGGKVTIVSGQILKTIKPETLQKLAELLKQSSSVICCRVSPKDKETLTRMVREWGRTLAVGDGANDVNMINAANVGVGVRGIEGSQATRAADYVISEFKILKRLVIYWGLNFYYRNSQVTLYNLYKNVLVTFPILAYGPISLVSSTYIYETWVFQFYNIFYTSLPIILFGLFDIKYRSGLLSTKPKLYQRDGQSSKHFNRKILARYVVMACLLGTALVYVIYYSTGYALLSEGFMIFQIWSGMLLFNVIVVTVNVRIYLISSQISLIMVFTSLCSVLSYYLIFTLVEIILYSDVKNVLNHQIQSPIFWLLLITLSFAVEGCEYAYLKLSAQPPQQQTEDVLLAEEKMEEREADRIEGSVHEHLKMKKDLSGKDNSSGYAFAEDEQRSMNII